LHQQIQQNTIYLCRLFRTFVLRLCYDYANRNTNKQTKYIKQMAKIKIILFDSPSKQLRDGTFPVCLKITHQRKRKYFQLGKNCTIKQWNKDTGRFRRSFPNYVKENNVLLKKESKANDIARDIERDGLLFSFLEFDKRFIRRNVSSLVKDYYDIQITDLQEQGKESTASPYTTTKNALLLFAKDSSAYRSGNLMLAEIDYHFLLEFEKWLRKERELKDTSISVYMRNIRTVLNKAIKKDKLLKPEQYPFHDYEISKLDHTTKTRATTKEVIHKIRDLTFPDHSKEQLAQHVFIFSYYSRGMNFVDISLLTKENIMGDRIEYKRSKTKKNFSFKILKPVRDILDFYLEHNKMKGDYIFPIYDESIHQTPKQMYNRRKQALRTINKRFPTIAKEIKMEGLKLTTYVSRHTYATTLKNADVSIAKISEALGHSTEKVTKIYLKQFEKDVLDDIDERIL